MLGQVSSKNGPQRWADLTTFKKLSNLGALFIGLYESLLDNSFEKF